MSNSGHEFIQVDAFTDEPFRGNPAAVLVLDGPVDEGWMQSVALEMNLSETAFCHPADAEGSDGSEEWALRWFTPTSEVDLCGHATLATAHVLFTERGMTDSGMAREIGFHTRSGRLAAVAAGSPGGGIRLDFPVDRLSDRLVDDALSEAIGCQVVAAADGATDLLLEVGSAAAVRNCSPDLKLVSGIGDRAVIVTAACDDRDEVAIVSRVFGPNVGIAEDPVTGSAHTTLAAWWAPRLGNAFRAEQASARGGEMDVELVGDRVHLTGRAVTVARGTLVA